MTFIIVVLVIVGIIIMTQGIRYRLRILREVRSGERKTVPIVDQYDVGGGFISMLLKFFGL